MLNELIAERPIVQLKLATNMAILKDQYCGYCFQEDEAVELAKQYGFATSPLPKKPNIVRRRFVRNGVRVAPPRIIPIVDLPAGGIIPPPQLPDPHKHKHKHVFVVLEWGKCFIMYNLETGEMAITATHSYRNDTLATESSRSYMPWTLGDVGKGVSNRTLSVALLWQINIYTDTQFAIDSLHSTNQGSLEDAAAPHRNDFRLRLATGIGCISR